MPIDLPSKRYNPALTVTRFSVTCTEKNIRPSNPFPIHRNLAACQQIHETEISNYPGVDNRKAKEQSELAKKTRVQKKRDILAIILVNIQLNTLIPISSYAAVMRSSQSPSALL